MVLLTLTLLLAAERGPELKIAAPGLNTSGLDASVAGPLTDHIAKAFSGIRVITPRDISALIGLERQKALLGCSEDASQCMAELGNALGVQGVLVGDIVKLGKSIQINARIIDPVDGRELATASARLSSDDEIFDALTRVGLQLRTQFLAARGGAPAAALAVPARPAEAVSAGGGGSRRFFPIPIALGAGALVGGVVMIALSEGAYQRLTSGALGSVSIFDAANIARDGQLFQVAGAALITVGLAAAVAGAGLLIFGSGADATQPSATLGLGPGGVVFTGTLW